jgi:hypothetical protein
MVATVRDGWLVDKEQQPVACFSGIGTSNRVGSVSWGVPEEGLRALM